MAIVHSKKPSPTRVKPSKAAPACGHFVTAKHPSRIAALRMRSEVIKADPPVRQTMDGARPATAEEIAECLRFAAHSDPMIAKIAAERLLEHLQSCGYVLTLAEDATGRS